MFEIQRSFCVHDFSLEHKSFLEVKTFEHFLAFTFDYKNNGWSTRCWPKNGIIESKSSNYGLISGHLCHFKPSGYTGSIPTHTGFYPEVTGDNNAYNIFFCVFKTKRFQRHVAYEHKLSLSIKTLIGPIKNSIIS